MILEGRVLLLTDLDGTLIKGDSFLIFLRYCSGNPISFGLKFFLNTPLLIFWKLGLMSTETAKAKLLYKFLGKKKQGELEKIGLDFSSKFLRPRVRGYILERIERVNSRGGISIVVSASPEFWVKPLAESLNSVGIATRLELTKGQFQGRISGKNCKGEEKVKRIEQEVDLGQFDEIWVFGNSSGDKPMLRLGTKTWYKEFA